MYIHSFSHANVHFPPVLQLQQLADLLNWENLPVPLWWPGCLAFPRFIFIPDPPCSGCWRNLAHQISSNNCLCAQGWGWAGPCLKGHKSVAALRIKAVRPSWRTKLRHLGQEAAQCSQIEHAYLVDALLKQSGGGSEQWVRGENPSGEKKRRN